MLIFYQDADVVVGSVTAIALLVIILIGTAMKLKVYERKD